MQPSKLEIQREVEALRDIRRRSTSQGGPGALILDPDLPHESSPTSPSASYWTPNLTDGDSSSSSNEDSSSSEPSSSNDNPFHLFWVPASVHPEIAPAEFRAFLKEHARALPADGSLPERSNSTASISSFSELGRKRSMLSRQYNPSDNDVVEDEKIMPLKRNRSVFSNTGPQLTINDLQRLEELADEASRSDDPTKLRRILRRSLSLNVAPSAAENMDVPDMGDEADAPIIVPRPGQILRRTARTKIRKPGLPGDGGGHRFGASTRRGSGTRSGTAPPASMEPRTSSDLSSSDHDSEPIKRGRSFSNEAVKDGVRSVIRPESYSEEALIYDAYMREEMDEEDFASPVVVTSPPEPTSIELPVSPPLTEEPVSISEPILHHPQPQRLLSPPPVPETESSRTPSPDTASQQPSSPPSIPEQSARLSSDQLPFLSTPPPPRKEKDKKGGLFGKWGGDKGTKRSSKEAESRERAEKDTGFFGSLFGAKKKSDESGSQTLASGREAAAALLGASKSMSNSPSPGLGGVAGSYARYPIHVERAIYRLSHIKLANPRRPLYEQVLISNLMFWYLGVINKAQASASPGAQSSPNDKEQSEREQKEREEKARADRERAEREKEQQKAAEQKKESPRRGSLTKAPSTGSLSGRRVAEMPVKGPQYEMQHRVMEQEYGAYNTQPVGRATSAPSGGTKLYQPQPQPASGSNNFYYGNTSHSDQHSPPPHLPPGAMPPVSGDQESWRSSSAPSTSRSHSSPSPPPSNSSPGGRPGPRRSKSPPHTHSQNQNRFAPIPAHEKHMQGVNRPGRSLSAAAVAPPPNFSQSNGKPLRKGVSAHAVVPVSNGRRPRASTGAVGTASEEEDVPLALWQQQRRR